MNESLVSSGLVSLTEMIAKKQNKILYGGLGGPNEYGIDFENDVFMMHPYCWCEKDDCGWCAACECEEFYYLDNKKVSYKQWMEVFEKATENLEGDKWDIEAEKINNRRHIEKSGIKCAVCLVGGPSPNFRHKPSGQEVHWYKYIGRSMEIGDEIAGGLTDKLWLDILQECIKSL